MDWCSLNLRFIQGDINNHVDRVKSLYQVANDDKPDAQQLRFRRVNKPAVEKEEQKIANIKIFRSVS